MGLIGLKRVVGVIGAVPSFIMNVLVITLTCNFLPGMV